ncbi:MAG: hypothetical protein K6E99_02080 [Bacilli bacterium]|nr:hypothetical protein [Bacilli bacterium]
MEFDKKINSSCNEVLFIASPRLGNTSQQLHIINDLYEKAKDRGVDTVINLGDIADGEYYSRVYDNTQFINNLKEQAKYISSIYPYVEGITTYYMDSTKHYSQNKDEEFELNDIIKNEREDMVYVGDKCSYIKFNRIKMVLDSTSQRVVLDSQYRLRNSATRLMANKVDFDFLVNGTQHEDYIERYHDKILMSTPVVHSNTCFESIHGINNHVGGVFVKFYTDDYGKIDYVDFDPVLYGKSDFWDEADKDSQKVKQLVIKK